MRKALRLILLCVSLSVAAGAAVAQPRRQSQPAAPARDARCEEARYRYEAVTSDKAHRTVEEQEWVQYSEARKYLRLCWDEGDYLTQTLKKYVYFYEADVRCDAAWKRLGPALLGDGTDSLERGVKSHEAAEEFARICDGARTKESLFVRAWLEKYDAAARRFDAERTLASLVADARAGRADASAYARMGEAIVKAEYEPRKLELTALVESGKSPESKEAREAWARVASSLDAIVDAYARALASCAPGEGCEVAKDYWAGNLTTYYMLRHDGSQEGLAQTLAGALARPLPSH